MPHAAAGGPVTLSPAPGELAVDGFAVEAPASGASLIIIRAHTTRVAVACPVCGTLARRVHSRYTRTLQDLPWHGVAVRLELRTRRFACALPGCQRRVFTERLPQTAAPSARRTRRLAGLFDAVVLAVGGAAGARLLAALGLTGSADTLLRAAHATPLPSDGAAPRVLGVDDWAWRRGRSYGTVLCDLERGRIVDLLPERDAATLATWLRAHPGTEIISRDRAGAYAEGASAGAPDAIQGADRFHLVCNLTTAVQPLVEREAAALRAAERARAHAAETRRVAARPVQREYRARQKDERRALRLGRYEEVVALWRAGRTVSEIVAHTGLSRGTLDRWLKAGAFPERAAHPPRRCGLDRHRDFLRQRWDAGCHNATALWRELQQRGVAIGLSQVRWYVRTRLRHGRGAIRRAAEEPYTAPATRLSAHRVAWLLTRAEADLTDADRQLVARVCAESAPLAATRAVAVEFIRVLREHDVAAFDVWRTTAAGTPLARFARTLERDLDAVRHAVALPWSNGGTEGHVNRLKLVKRSMYGRASIALLRRRVIAA